MTKRRKISSTGAYQQNDVVTYSSSSNSDSSDVAKINLMSWNMANLGGGFGYPETRSKAVIEAMASIIKGQSPDILVVQEVLQSGRPTAAPKPPKPVPEHQHATRYKEKRLRSSGLPDRKSKLVKRKRKRKNKYEPGVRELRRILEMLNTTENTYEVYPALKQGKYTHGETYGVFYKPDTVELLTDEIHFADHNSKKKFFGRAPLIMPFRVKKNGVEFEMLVYHAPSDSSRNRSLRKNDFACLKTIIDNRRKTGGRPMILAADLNNEDMDYRKQLVDTSNGHRLPLTSQRRTSLRKSKLQPSNDSAVRDLVRQYTRVKSDVDVITRQITGFLRDSEFDHRSRRFDSILVAHDPDGKLMIIEDRVVPTVTPRNNQTEQIRSLTEARRLSDHLPVGSIALVHKHGWRQRDSNDHQATKSSDSMDTSEHEQDSVPTLGM